jgi:hypothetical protein
MTDDEFNELMELRTKVRLTPDYHPLSRLSEFLALQRYLSTYTKEEIESLLAQSEELPAEEQQELLDRGYGQNPNFFNLSEEERAKLDAARKKLTLSQRALLSDVFIDTAAGSAWLDIGKVSNTFIQLDDKSSKERETRPYVHIYLSDHFHRRVETIDILESVNNDPLAVGHPAIVFAIYHWQRVIYTRRVIGRRDITFNDEWRLDFMDEFRGGRDVRSAENNLKAISETLYDAAEKRAIPVESALALKMQECNLLGPNERDTVVYKAWETLKGDFIRQAAGADEVLQKIEPEIEAFEAGNDTGLWRIRVGRVMAFLQDSSEKGGRRFV